MLVEFSRSAAGVIALALAMLPVSAFAAQQQEEMARLTGGANEPFAISYDEVEKIPEAYRRQEVPYENSHSQGTLVVDTGARFLYLVLEEGRALRYGIAVGRDGFQWSGTAEIGRKASWPRWTPPKAMVARDSFAAKWAKGMPGGPKNPLGARALYLFANGTDTLFRIHGTNQPSSIGQAASSGCVRMLNADVVDLYDRVDTGTKVVVINSPPPAMTAQVKRPKRPPQVAAQTKPRVAVQTKLPNKKFFTARKTAMKPPLVRKTNFNLRKDKLALQ
jgi:lipoprotein-anchoring transpeptidase ErfK/SrfK